MRPRGKPKIDTLVDKETVSSSETNNFSGINICSEFLARLNGWSAISALSWKNHLELGIESFICFKVKDCGFLIEVLKKTCDSSPETSHGQHVQQSQDKFYCYNLLKKTVPWATRTSWIIPIPIGLFGFSKR